MPEALLPWMDLLWLPLALLAVRKGQRLLVSGFVLCCLFSLRLQQELLESIGAAGTGLTGWIEMAPYWRGQIVYGLFIFVFLLLSRISPRTSGIIYMAAAISVYIAAFAVSMVVMVI